MGNDYRNEFERAVERGTGRKIEEIRKTPISHDFSDSSVGDRERLDMDPSR